MTKKDYLAKCLKEGSSSQSQEPGERWAKAVNMFTHISQLIVWETIFSMFYFKSE